MNDKASPMQQRPIRSFVRRSGRMTQGQASAFKRLLPLYGIAYEEAPLNLGKVFGRTAPCTLEIGFGNGEALVNAAAADKEGNYLGVEVYEPGVGHCLIAAEQNELTNLRVICHDAIDVLQQQIPNDSLDTLRLLFPDPWHKKRHNKRRIVQPAFIKLVASKLQRGGTFHVATDWQPYAEHIEEVLAAQAALQCADTPPPERSVTRFEQRGQRRGHAIWEKVWQRA